MAEEVLLLGFKRQIQPSILNIARFSSVIQSLKLSPGAPNEKIFYRCRNAVFALCVPRFRDLEKCI